MEIAGIKLFPFVGFVLAILGFVLQLIGFAAPYWFQNGDIHGGLWKYCLASACVSGSAYIRESWQEAVQAMEVLGFLLLLGALVVVILKLFIIKDKNILKWAIIGCLGAAALFILIGVGVFGAKSEADITDNLHFCFAFCIIAAICSIVAAVLFLLDK